MIFIKLYSELLFNQSLSETSVYNSFALSVNMKHEKKRERLYYFLVKWIYDSEKPIDEFSVIIFI